MHRGFLHSQLSRCLLGAYAGARALLVAGGDLTYLVAAARGAHSGTDQRGLSFRSFLQSAKGGGLIVRGHHSRQAGDFVSCLLSSSLSCQF